MNKLEVKCLVTQSYAKNASYTIKHTSGRFYESNYQI